MKRLSKIIVKFLSPHRTNLFIKQITDKKHRLLTLFHSTIRIFTLGLEADLSRYSNQQYI